MVKKVKLGQEVYTIYHDCILKEVVYAIGDGFFIPEYFQDKYDDAQIIYFEDTYSTFEKVEKAFRKKFKEYCRYYDLKYSSFQLKETIKGQWEYIEVE